MQPSNTKPLIVEGVLISAGVVVGMAVGRKLDTENRNFVVIGFVTLAIVSRQVWENYRRRNPRWIRTILGETGWRNWCAWSLERRRTRNELKSFALATAATLCAVCGMSLIGFFEMSFAALLAGVIGMGCSCAALSDAGRQTVRIGQRVIAKQRDDRGQELAEQAISGTKVAPFVLYLRPFIVGGRLFTANPKHVPVIMHSDYHFHVPFLELEQWVSEAVSPIGPLISITEQNGGIAVPTSNRPWEDVFEALAQAAKLVIVLPFDRPGTLHEIKTLRELELFHKTVFIMPPTVAIDYFPVKLDTPKEPFDAATAWGNSAARLAMSFGMLLPPYDQKGGLIIPRSQGLQELVAPFNIMSQEHFVRDLLRFVPAFAGTSR